MTVAEAFANQLEHLHQMQPAWVLMTPSGYRRREPIEIQLDIQIPTCILSFVNLEPDHVPAGRLTRNESHEETRKRLVTSAIELFAQRGVTATSLNAVAEHAGFSRGAVHGNYSGKDDLATTVAESVTGALAPRLGQILAASAPSGERLDGYIHAFLEFCSQHPNAAGALIAVVDYLGRRDPQYYSDRAAASLGDLTDLFEDGQRRGEMRDFDPRTMAFAVRTVLDSAATRLSADQTDTGALATEIAALFTAATRKEVTSI